MHDDFTGRVAVVTGGSEGLGRDFCQALCELGCEVYFCARGRERGHATANELGSRCHFVQADVADPNQIVAFMKAIAQKVDHVDYLVNNVAVDDRIPFEAITSEECDRLWATNLRSYMLVSRAFLDLLRQGSGKSIVNVVSTCFMLGHVEMSVYNAAKSGIVGFTRSLARELGPESIRANMVTPGWIMTEKQLRLYVKESDKEELLEEQSLKFLLEPEHVTPAVLFFLSSAARAVTGQNLVVDGGKVMY